MGAARTTALDQFQRLETTGLWRAGAGEQRREVVVAFGSATLVISDAGGRPLSHWSLAAVTRLNPGERPALYAPDADTGETLEIDDALMIDAIGRVQAAIAGAAPRSRRLRRVLVGALVVLLAGSAFALPGIARRQALALVPQTTRQEIGATLLGLMSRETGPACRAPRGAAALERLVRRLYGAGARLSIVVLPGDMGGMVALPGGLLVVPRAALADSDDPLVFAGEVVAARAGVGAGARDPLGAALESAGLRATFILLGTGRLPARALEGHASALLHQTPELADDATLAAAFAAADLASGPWALATDHPLPEPETTETAPVMPDADWIALQSICAG
ncbi:MAG: hypothetical protein H3C51_04075 [Rubellimicrobium sp.]|nr:hypothetical protein [Rubellimicrobium sp.]